MKDKKCPDDKFCCGNVFAGKKTGKTAALLKGRSQWDMYLALLGVGIPSPAGVVTGTRELRDVLKSEYPDFISGDLDRMMLIDQLFYLPDDLLAKVRTILTS